MKLELLAGSSVFDSCLIAVNSLPYLVENAFAQAFHYIRSISKGSF